jgi:hypothetical protein
MPIINLPIKVIVQGKGTYSPPKPAAQTEPKEQPKK